MPPRKTPPSSSTPVRELWNLSEVIASWLHELGIDTYGQLVDADLIEVWVELKGRHKQVTNLMYFALWGAVHNCHWNLIPDSEKAKLDLIRG